MLHKSRSAAATAVATLFVLLSSAVIAGGTRSEVTSSTSRDPPQRVTLTWSTGHTGTTSLSRASAFDTNFERDGGLLLQKFEECCPRRDEWRRWGAGDERLFVSEKFWPHVSNESMKHWAQHRFKRNKMDAPSLANGSTAVPSVSYFETGHCDLFYIHGVLDDHLLAVANKNVTVVRLRRERYENALSLTWQKPGDAFPNICNLRFGFCPFHRTGDLATAAPSAELWARWSVFQQALWVVDETAARWEALRASHPPTSRRRFLDAGEWSSSIPGSFERVADAFAATLGVQRPAQGRMPAEKVHRSPETRAEQANAREGFLASDCAYRRSLVKEAMGDEDGGSEPKAVAPFAPAILCHRYQDWPRPGAVGRSRKSS